MMQNPWFKAFIWFIASAFFFLAAGILISALGPGPTEQQTMLYMSGMMGAMHNSLMGLSMTLEQDYELKSLIADVSSLTIPLILISTIAGVYIRFLRGGGDAP